MMIPVAMLQTSPSDITSVGPSLMPLVFAALLLDVAIIVIWYYIGVIMQNSRVRESAKGEYYQLIGTVILVVLLLWVIVTYSTMATTIFGATKLMSPSAISSLCTNIEKTTQLNILSGGAGTPAAIQGGSFLYGYNTISGNNIGGLCTILTGTSLTNKIDYPLAATGVIIANLTNQTVSNLNSTFTIDSFFGFLVSLKPTVTVCLSHPPEALPCFVPTFSEFYIGVTAAYAPYAGYNLLYSSLSSLGTLLTVAMESYIAQIIVIWIILFIWPYLLFGGIVLRATFFTRKIGGLLIAIALGAIIIFPTVYAIEYLTLGNGIPNLAVPSSVTALPENAIYGFNDITYIPQNTLSGSFPTQNQPKRQFPGHEHNGPEHHKRQLHTQLLCNAQSPKDSHQQRLLARKARRCRSSRPPILIDAILSRKRGRTCADCRHQ